MNQLNELLRMRRSLSMNPHRWGRLHDSPAWFHDRFMGVNYYRAPDESFEFCESLTSECVVNGISSEELIIGLTLDCVPGKGVEIATSAGNYIRPATPGTLTFFDGRAMRNVQGTGLFLTMYVYFPIKMVNAHLSEILGKEYQIPEKLIANAWHDTELMTYLHTLLYDAKRNREEKNIAKSQLLFDGICRRLLHLSGEKASQPTPEDRLPKPAIRRVLDYLNSHYQEELNLEMLSKIAGISRGHLSRLFHQTMGQSLKTYLLQIRIEKAKELLASEPAEVSLNEIAARCGFYDRTHLSHEFRRQTGLPPSQFRKNAMS